MKRALIAERFSVDVANDGATGLELAKTYDCDFIILDLLLPEIDGSEVLRRVRRFNPHVPVLILTARDSGTVKVANFEAAADDNLTEAAAAPRHVSPNVQLNIGKFCVFIKIISGR